MPWPLVPLSEVVALQRGHDLPSRLRKPGVVPVVGSAGISGFHSEAIVPGPGLVIGRSGASIGKATYVTTPYWPLNTGLYATSFRGNEPYWVYLALGQLDLAQLNSGSAQPSLNRNNLGGLRVSRPPKPAQRAIAEVLGALDDKIAANAVLRDSSRELRGASLRVALNGGQVKVFLGEGTVLLGRGKAPSYTQSAKGVLVINQKCVRDGTVALDQARLAEVMREPQLAFGDVLVNSTGMGTLGRVGVWRHSVPAFPDSHVTVLRFADDFVDPWVGAEAVLASQAAIEALGEGSTGQTELSRKALAALQLTLPERASQVQLGLKLRALHAREHQASEESGSLAKLRDFLLPHLMSGRITVREAEERVEEVL